MNCGIYSPWTQDQADRLGKLKTETTEAILTDWDEVGPNLNAQNVCCKRSCWPQHL
jgi:hypothetical protein